MRLHHAERRVDGLQNLVHASAGGVDAHQTLFFDERYVVPQQLGDQRRAIIRVDQHVVLAHLRLELGRRALGHDVAVVDDAHAVRLLGLLEIMRGQKDGRAAGRAHGHQVLPQVAAADRVEPERWLI